MPTRSIENHTARNNGRLVLELTVRNHPGVMSHVCGLFSRRAYNLEAIACLPLAETKGAQSRIWLLIEKDGRLEQIVKQVAQLEDVQEVRGPLEDLRVFDRLAECVRD